MAGYPKGTRIVHRRVIHSGEHVADDVKIKAASSVTITRGRLVNPECLEAVSIGIPREPEDFIREAHAKGHPRSFLLQLEEYMRQVIRANARCTTAEVETHRTEFVKHWMHEEIS